MGKTKEQVNRYLIHCEFPDDDWQKVLVFCRKNGLGYAHKSSRPKSASSFNQFIDWLRSGYGSGDVVRYGHTIGILSVCTPDYTVLCAHFSYDGKLLVTDLQVSTDKIIAGTDTDRKRIYGALKLSGLDFDDRLARVYQKKLPAVFSRIAYRYGDISGYGVIGRYDGDVAHFVFGIENGVVRRDFEIPIYDLATDAIDKVGILAINDALNAALLRWNHQACKLEDLQPRVRVGDTYWYITDKFSVSSAIENRAPTNEVRYERGNYFLNHSEAVEFLSAIMKMRKK